MLDRIITTILDLGMLSEALPRLAATSLTFMAIFFVATAVLVHSKSLRIAVPAFLTAAAVGLMTNLVIFTGNAKAASISTTAKRLTHGPCPGAEQILRQSFEAHSTLIRAYYIAASKHLNRCERERAVATLKRSLLLPVETAAQAPPSEESLTLAQQLERLNDLQ